MTAVLVALPVALFAAYLLARSVNRRGWAATWDSIWHEPPVTDAEWTNYRRALRRVFDKEHTTP